MKGKTRDEARAELEKQGVSGSKLDLILPHKVGINWRYALLHWVAMVIWIFFVMIFPVLVQLLWFKW